MAEILDVDGELAEGTRVGQYVVLRRLGRGSFGAVYEAEQPEIEQRVAIKVLHASCSATSDGVRRFVNEARAIGRISHPNIVQLFAFGRLDDGRAYHVMERLEGSTLAAALAERGALPTPEALPLLWDIAHALDAAHAAGIVHRDLKPSNVFVTRDHDGRSRAKLLDFGIAKLATPEDEGPTTASGALLGTPHYMSPEQCHAREVGPQSDIYAFGVLAYEVLTGSRPFDGSDRLEILMKQVSDAPEPPSARAQLPRELDRTLLRLLAKQPEDRPASLEQAAAAIELSLTGGRYAAALPKRKSWAIRLSLLAVVTAVAASALARREEPDPARAARTAMTAVTETRSALSTTVAVSTSSSAKAANAERPPRPPTSRPKNLEDVEDPYEAAP
jgi:serine/threonine protein kinase